MPILLTNAILLCAGSRLSAQYTPVSPIAPTDPRQCSDLRAAWDALQQQKSAQHQACLDANAKAPSNPVGTCSRAACQSLHDEAFGDRIRKWADYEVDYCNKQVDAYQKRRALLEEQKRREEAERERTIEANREAYQQKVDALNRQAAEARQKAEQAREAREQWLKKLAEEKDAARQGTAAFSAKAAALTGSMKSESQKAGDEGPSVEFESLPITVGTSTYDRGAGAPTQFGEGSAATGPTTQMPSPAWNPDAAAGIATLTKLSDQVSGVPKAMDTAIAEVSKYTDALALEVPFLAPLATAMDTYKGYLDIVKARSDALSQSNSLLQASIQTDLKNTGQASLYGQCVGGDASACRGVQEFLSPHTAALYEDNQVLYQYYVRGFDSNNWTDREKGTFLSDATSAAVPLTYSKRLAQAKAWCEIVGPTYCPRSEP